jgi:hypothetical protein
MRLYGIARFGHLCNTPAKEMLFPRRVFSLISSCGGSIIARTRRPLVKSFAQKEPTPGSAALPPLTRWGLSFDGSSFQGIAIFIPYRAPGSRQVGFR